MKIKYRTYKGEALLNTGINVTPIGVIETPFKNHKELHIPPWKPEAPYHNPDIHGKVNLFKEYWEGAKSIEPLSYYMLVFHFDRSEGYELTTVSSREGKSMGVFSTRSPYRPNGIGISIVQFISVKEEELIFRGVDILDGTPLLDIKPYFEARPFD